MAVFVVVVFTSLFPARAHEVTPAEVLVLRDVRPVAAFQYFSGAVPNHQDHPTIYAHQSHGQFKLVVLGRGFHQEYDIKQQDEAIDAYRRLLASRGYVQAK